MKKSIKSKSCVKRPSLDINVPFICLLVANIKEVGGDKRNLTLKVKLTNTFNDEQSLSYHHYHLSVYSHTLLIPDEHVICPEKTGSKKRK